jgi:hypothetical protein
MPMVGTGQHLLQPVACFGKSMVRLQWSAQLFFTYAVPSA